MIIDGREIAEEILMRTKVRAGKLSYPPLVVAIAGDDTPATRSYLRIKEKKGTKAGCVFQVRTWGATMEDADAVIVQLPLREGVDASKILDGIPLTKDADVLSSVAREKFERNATDALLPPVVAAVKEIFEHAKVEPLKKRAVVIGEGWLVGKPVATWLRVKGAEVVIANSKTEDLAAALRAADIIVSGAGVPGLIKPEMLKDGVVLVDAATSESNGVIKGDADPACAAKCALFTPVPGGVGPVAVACLFANAVTLAEQAK